MAKLTIRNTHPNLDGDYELELANGFTKTEYFIMQKHVGVLADDMLPGSRINVNVMTAWGLVAIRRAGKEHLFPLYMDTDDTQTAWEFDEEEAGEDPAVPTMSGSGEPVEPNVRSESSGPSTNGGSDVSLAVIPPAIGSPPSDTFVTSDPEISAT
jgi:hypothetical protein